MKIKNRLAKYLSIFFISLICSGIASAEDPPIIGNMEDATWEIFTNRSNNHALLLSDDKTILWVGTSGGFEERDALNGRLERVYINTNSVYSLLSDGAGDVWAGSGGLTHLILIGTPKQFPKTDTSNITMN